MEHYIFNILEKYFNTLFNVGYISNDDIEKLMVVIIIEELTHNNFRYCLKKDDIILMENVLNKYYGTACSVPFQSCLNCN